MGTFGLPKLLIAFAVFTGLALTPSSAFAQRGGGGVAVTAVVAGAVSTVGAEASIVEVVEASTVAVEAAVESSGAAASTAVRGLWVEEVTTRAAPDVILPRPQAIRRIFLPQSMMASGIRSATPLVLSEVPHVPVPVARRNPAKHVIPEAWRTQASRLVTPEFPMAPGTRLAGPAVARQEASRVSSAEPSTQRRASVGVVMVGEAVGAVATVGVVAGVGAVGASASDGHTGVLLGTGLGLRLGSLLVCPLLVCPLARILLLLSGLWPLQL